MTQNTETASKFEFVDLPEDTGSNEYDSIVAALNEAGEGKGYVLTTPTDDHKKHLRRFQEAAHRIDRTARKVKTTEDGDTTSTTIRLRPKVVKKNTADAEVDAAQDSE